MTTLAKYYVENNKIVVLKTFFGREKVLVNGVAVSNKSVKENALHHFSIEKDKYQIAHREALQAEKMNTFEIVKNGMPIALVDRASNNSFQILIMVVAVGLGCGFMIGILVYTTL